MLDLINFYWRSKAGNMGMEVPVRFRDNSRPIHYIIALRIYTSLSSFPSTPNCPRCCPDWQVTRSLVLVTDRDIG